MIDQTVVQEKQVHGLYLRYVPDGHNVPLLWEQGAAQRSSKHQTEREMGGFVKPEFK